MPKLLFCCLFRTRICGMSEETESEKITRIKTVVFTKRAGFSFAPKRAGRALHNMAVQQAKNGFDKEFLYELPYKQLCRHEQLPFGGMRRNLCDYSGNPWDPKARAVPITADIRRTSIYNTSAGEAQTWNGTTVSARVVPDDTMYSASQETYSIKIRRQNPTAKFLSLCEVATFVSGGGARTSERVQWSENGVRCEVPSV